jgi:hypothetical protein
MEPYLVCFLTGVISGWGANSLPDMPGFSSVDPDGINVALMYKKGKGKILLEILHYQFLLAIGLVILEILLLPIKWYFTILWCLCGVMFWSFFLFRFYRRLSRGDSKLWRYVDLLVYDSPIAASLSFLGIMVMLAFVIAKWWNK